MILSDLIARLRIDLADPNGELLDDSTLTRCIGRGMLELNRDLSKSFRVAEGAIIPELSEEETDLLLLLAATNACSVMRTATASGFAFSSGDKKVDKTKQAQRWAELENDFRERYRLWLAEIRPETALSSDDIIVPHGMNAVIYEQGSDA